MGKKHGSCFAILASPNFKFRFSIFHDAAILASFCCLCVVSECIVYFTITVSSGIRVVISVFPEEWNGAGPVGVSVVREAYIGTPDSSAGTEMRFWAGKTCGHITLTTHLDMSVSTLTQSTEKDKKPSTQSKCTQQREVYHRGSG